MTSSNCTSSCAAQCTLIQILPHGLRQLCLRLFSPVYLNPILPCGFRQLCFRLFSPVYLNPIFALWSQAIVLQVVQPGVLKSKFCLVASGNCASGCAAQCTLIQILPCGLRQSCFRLCSPVYVNPDFAWLPKAIVLQVAQPSVFYSKFFALWPQAVVVQVVQPNILKSKFCLMTSGNWALDCPQPLRDYSFDPCLWNSCILIILSIKPPQCHLVVVPWRSRHLLF